MALIKCYECGKEISDTTKRCIHCGYINKKTKTIKDKKKKEELKKDKKSNKKLIIYIAIAIIIIIISLILLIKPKDNKIANATICKNLTSKLQVYIDNKDTKGFDDAWLNREAFDIKDKNCSTVDCVCRDAWDLYLKNMINKADEKLKAGFISSSYNEISFYISKENMIKEYHDKHNIYKLISSKQKEEITGIYYSFGEWSWKYKVGGKFKFKRRYVNYASSYLTLQFDNYNDKVLISGHLKPSKHKNWNKEKNISTNWYNYKVLNNKIYIKLESESENKYDAIFQIKKLTDTKLSLKLLLNLEDVKAGQVYEFNYVRS